MASKKKLTKGQKTAKMYAKTTDVQLRVSDKEKRVWQREAKTKKMSLSAWIRNTLAKETGFF